MVKVKDIFSKIKNLVKETVSSVKKYFSNPDNVVKLAKRLVGAAISALLGKYLFNKGYAYGHDDTIEQIISAMTNDDPTSIKKKYRQPNKKLYSIMITPEHEDDILHAEVNAQTENSTTKNIDWLKPLFYNWNKKAYYKITHALYYWAKRKEANS